MSKVIYVCSPYRAATAEQFNKQLEYTKAVAKEIVLAGHDVIVPHLYYTHFLDDDIDEERKLGMKSEYHPTQKPIALMEYLIKTYTNENELVLDFTMGSGTTGVACKKLNRDFISIELDKHYYRLAKHRIRTTNTPII